MDRGRLRKAYDAARERLLMERHSDGYWVGELAASALSTATAVAALAMVHRVQSLPEAVVGLITQGLRWLEKHQNSDGGWGDTVLSFSNISTTMLCRAAFHIAGEAKAHASTLERCDNWLAERYGSSPDVLAEAIRRRYGKDRTFAVPILTMSALAGLVPWKEIPRLPYELACLPQSWYRFARLPVVSYALPALIAMGQCIQHHRPTWNPIAGFFRMLGRGKSLRVLRRIQPESGGYLEATPLTSFVMMSLASIQERCSIGEAGLAVLNHGVRFLVDSVRPDGSWPIDTNLSLWVTSLSINALHARGDAADGATPPALLPWLLRQQVLIRHPYTGADPGGWGWSDLSGSVPDCDDTAGMLLALSHLLGEHASQAIDEFVRASIGKRSIAELEAHSRQKLDVPRGNVPMGFQILAGLDWMLNLQNKDGGWPTFCRGWGTLPFDRSGTDLTAHALRALQKWERHLFASNVAGILLDGMGVTVYANEARFRFPTRKRIQRAREAGLGYLTRMQRDDGSWLPLWFGNQHATEDINPTYGTARVLAAYRDLGLVSSEQAQRGLAFLLSVRNQDGGWGGDKGTPSSIEETGLVVELLASWPSALQNDAIRGAIEAGTEYLVLHVENGHFVDPSPIGFYFAKLWYFEKLYPIIFTTAGLGQVLASLDHVG